jgi:molecular chaperone GrpE (heat shock protein)
VRLEGGLLDGGRLEGVPAGDVLACLVGVHRALAALGDRTVDDTLRTQVEEQVAALAMRGRRLEDLADLPHEQLSARWADEELPALVDGLGRLLSAARAPALLAKPVETALCAALERMLFDELRPMIAARGWFDVVIVRPLSTAFDPACHQVVERRAWAGHDGVVIEVMRMGRRRLDTGALLEPALVVVAG